MNCKSCVRGNAGLACLEHGKCQRYLLAPFYFINGYISTNILNWFRHFHNYDISKNKKFVV